MIRFFDFLFSLVGLILLGPVLLLLVMIGFFFTSKPIFIQKRLGKNKEVFTLIKFRTLPIHTPHVASHELEVAHLNGWFRTLRKYKLDELPQLFNVLTGSMSLVGPRPCLPTQSELITHREQNGIFTVRPGITGFAQVQGYDMSQPALLAKVEAETVFGISLGDYFKWIFATVFGKGSGDAINL